MRQILSFAIAFLFVLSCRSQLGVDNDPALLYAKGQEQFAGGNMEEAVVSFLSALSQAEASDNYKLQGQIAEVLGEMSNLAGNHVDEKVYALRALACFELGTDSLAVDIARYNLALALHNTGDHSPLDSLLDKINDWWVYRCTFPLRADHEMMQEHPDYAKASEWFEKALDYGVEMNEADYYKYAYSLVRTGRKREADSLLVLMKDYPESVSSRWWKYQISKERGDSEAAYMELERYSQLRDSLGNESLMQKLSKKQADYLRLSMEETRKQKSISYLVATIITLLFFLLIGVFLWTWNVHRRKVMTLNDLMQTRQEKVEEMIALAHRDTEEGRNHLEDLRRMFVRIYQEKFEEVIDLTQIKAEEKLVSQASMQQHWMQVSRILSEISDPAKQKKFEARINKDLDNIMYKIRTDFPKLREDDYRFLSYIIVGFDTASLSVLFDQTPGAVRVRKTRLKSILLNSESENKGLYSIFFS